MTKKGDMEIEWLVHVGFYLALLVVLVVITWLLISGKMTTMWSSLMEKLRFV